jgi:hypothetical protein
MVLSDTITEKYRDIYIKEARELFCVRVISNGVLFNDITFKQSLILIRHFCNYPYIFTKEI